MPTDSGSQLLFLSFFSGTAAIASIYSQDRVPCRTHYDIYSMADRSLITLPTEITEGFLEGLTSPYELYVADSTMSGAGFGLFVRGEIPAGKEIFRAAVPAVSAV